MATLQDVLEAVKTLAPTERQSLREALNAWPDAPEAANGSANGTVQESEAEREARAYQIMLERGLIERLPDLQALAKDYKHPTLFEIEGEPLSETIMRERR